MKMKKRILLVGVTLLAFLISNQAESCDHENFFEGTFKLNAVYDKKLHHEIKIIKKIDKNNLSSIVGKIIPINRSYWYVKDSKKELIGRIDKNLIFRYKDDLCNTSKIQFEYKLNKKYFVTKNGIYIGEIHGRFPRI
jgi:hypothetical protein